MDDAALAAAIAAVVRRSGKGVVISRIIVLGPAGDPVPPARVRACAEAMLAAGLLRWRSETARWRVMTGPAAGARPGGGDQRGDTLW